MNFFLVLIGKIKKILKPIKYKYLRLKELIYRKVIYFFVDTIGRDNLNYFGDKIHYFESEENISGNYSDYSFVNFSVIPFWVNVYEKGLTINKPYYLELENAEIVGKRGIVVDCKGKVILESSVFQRVYFEKSRAAKSVIFRKFSKVKKEIDIAITLVNYLEWNYFHWVTESLTRLLVLNHFDIKPKIIVTKSGPHFIKESLLKLFNVDENDIIEYDYGRIKVKKLIVPAYRFVKNDLIKNCEIYSFNAFRNLNSLSKKVKSSHKFSENIIIQRKDVEQRKILNIDKLSEKLRDFNFLVYYLEEMSFEEQIALFRGAKIIIAAHGAGLSNLIFSENPVVFELFPENRDIFDAQLFYNISRALKIKHFLLNVESENGYQNLNLSSSLENTLFREIEKIIN